MRYKSYIPRFPLSAYVELLWLYEGSGDGCPREGVFSDGRAEVIINLGGDALRIFEGGSARATRFGEMVLCGPHMAAYLLDISARFQMMGIVFRPHGAASFLPVPTGEVFEARVPGDALWGSSSSLLRERLHEARTLQAKFQTLEAVLQEWLEQSCSAKRPHAAVAYALGELHRVPHARTIESLREQVGLSPRRFIRLFRDNVGMSPKVYARIQRFQAALHVIDHSEAVDWADVAFDCGYYDQSHFIRDFRTFTGFSPSAYAAARRRHLRHIPDEMRQFFTICAHCS